MEVDRGYSWVIVLAVTLQGICTSPLLPMMGLLFGPKLLKINSTETETATATSLFLFSWSLFTLFVGPLVQLRGERFVSFAASLCCIFGLGLCSFARNPLDFIICFGFIAGAGQGLYALNSILLINKHFKAKVGLAMALFVCGTGCGGLIMPQIVKLLLKNFEAETVIQIYTGIMSVGSLIGPILIRTGPMQPKKKENVETALKEPLAKKSTEAEDENKQLMNTNGKKSETVVKVEPRKPNRCVQFMHKVFIFRIFLMIKWSLLKNIKFVLISLGVSIAFNCFLFFSAQTSGICFKKGLTVSQVADVITISGGIGIGFRFLQGVIADLPCVRKRVKKPKTFLFLLSSVTFSASLYGLTQIWSYELVMVFIILSQIGIAGATVFGPLLMTEYFPEHLSSAMGICNVLRAVCAFLLGPIIGVLKDNSENSTPMLLFLATILLVVVFIWMLERFLSKSPLEEKPQA